MRLISSMAASLLVLNLSFALTLPATAADTMSNDDLASLETRFFQTVDKTDSVDQRLARLEQLVFGEVRTGTPQQRLDQLVAVVPHPSADAIPTPSMAETAQPAPANDVPDQTADASAAPASDDSASITDSSDYPHVTALEHELLGQTYVGQPVQSRVARLEIKAFGHASTNPDLGARTDQLEDYVDARFHKQPFGVNPEMISHDQDIHMPAPPRQVAPQVSLAPPAVNARMLDKVAWLETQTFGHTFPNLHLLERLRQLDAILLPRDQQKTSADLMDQVDTLMHVVELRLAAQQPAYQQVAYSNNQQPSYPQYQRFVQQQPSMPYAYSPQSYATQNQSAQTSGYDSSDASQTPSNQTSRQREHPLLKSLAHAMGVAANMAMSAGNSVGGMTPFGY